MLFLLYLKVNRRNISYINVHDEVNIDIDL